MKTIRRMDNLHVHAWTCLDEAKKPGIAGSLNAVEA